MGEGWWIASDGKWYPAESHPDAYLKQFSAPDAGTLPSGTPPSDMLLPDMPPVNAAVASAPDTSTPPAPGWWKASDGNWYAPELHPAAVESVEVTRPGRSAVTRSAGASAPGGVHAPAPRLGDGAGGNPHPGQADAPSPPNDLDFDPMLDFDTLFGGLDDPAPSRQAASPPVMSTPAASPRPAASPPVPPRPAAPPPSWLPAAVAAAPRPVGLRMPDHGSFNAAGGSSDHRPTAEPAPGDNADRRPINPGFNQARTPAPGSMLHDEAPSTGVGPGGALARSPRDDVFDELPQSVAPAPPPPRANPLQETREAPDGLRGAWTTSGGPASAVPHLSPQEADFFVLKPSHKKPKATHSKPRTKLSGLIFLLVLLLVLAAVAVAVIYIHH